jgi:hypothetical protein
MLARLSRLFSKETAAKGNEPPSEVMEFAGFVLAHCAAIADANRSGELICPFAVLSDGSGRRVVDFGLPSCGNLALVQDIPRLRGRGIILIAQMPQWGFLRVAASSNQSFKRTCGPHPAWS